MTDTTDQHDETAVTDEVAAEPRHKIIPELQHLMVPLEELHVWDDNARRGDVETLSLSLNEFGQYLPLVYVVEADGRKVMRIGNHRVMAARVLAWTHVAAFDGTHWTEAQMRAMSMLDNRSAQLGGFDEEILAEHLALIQGDGLLEYSGFSADDAAEILAGMGTNLGPDGTATDDEPQLYTSKITTPVYSPVLPEPPRLDEMVDRSKADDLIEKIESTPGLKPSDIAFLKWAAERHVRFHFESIAEFYAHADPEVQDLMEQSALVIIDIDKAIEHGFVKVTDRLLSTIDAQLENGI